MQQNSEMDGRKKRGSNYTVAEKKLLLELIENYQNIIEDKKTNASMIRKKREAWEVICQQYNTFAHSGFRTCHQLRHLYENLKHRSKKNIADINEEVKLTNGEANKPTLSEKKTQMSQKVVHKVQILPNPFDDAAEHFGDKEANTNTIKVEVTCEVSSDSITTDKTDKQDIVIEEDSLPDNSCAVTSNATDDQQSPKTSICNDISSARVSSAPRKTNGKRTQRNKGRVTSIKEAYFRTKLRNARLEAKYLMNKNKMELGKYKKEMEILNFRLLKLKAYKKIT